MSDNDSRSVAVAPEVVPRSGHNISRKNIDEEALKVLYRLHRAGHLGYLVGGAVRDLLLGKRPSDFDVGTDATPEEVRRLFRNSRIIGRRFRIVQVVFRGRKVVEVTTFRRDPDFAEAEEERLKASPPPEPTEEEAEEAPPKVAETEVEETPAAVAPTDGRGAARERSRRGNERFGTCEEDAQRRDLTINGLFYDIGSFSVIDYVGGLKDLRAGIIRFIGDSETKVKEDPVRVIRALRHAARTGFQIEPSSEAAIRSLSGLLSQCAPARIASELQRDLKSGHAEQMLQLMRSYGVLQALLPELAEIEADVWAPLMQALRRLDEKILSGTPADSVMAASVLLWSLAEPIVLARDGHGPDPGATLHGRLLPVFRRIGVARRDGATVELMYLALRRLWGHPPGRPVPPSLSRKPYFPNTRELYSLLRGHVLADAGSERASDSDVPRARVLSSSEHTPSGDGSGPAAVSPAFAPPRSQETPSPWENRDVAASALLRPVVPGVNETTRVQSGVGSADQRQNRFRRERPSVGAGAEPLGF